MNNTDINSIDEIKNFLIKKYSKWDKKDQEKLISHFSKLYGNHKDQLDREWINELISENGNKFQERYWELFLIEWLSKQDFSVKSSDKGPDCCIEYNNNKIWIEATCSGPGESCRIQSILERPYEAHYIPEDEYDLRLTNSASEKHRKFLKYQENGIVSDNDYIIIAINCFLLGPLQAYWGASTFPRIIDIAFGLGGVTYQLNLEKEEMKPPYIKKEPFISKENKSMVNKHFFLNEAHKNITGFIFTDLSPESAVFGSEKALKMIFVHNPLAKNKLPIATLNYTEEFFINPFPGNIRSSCPIFNKLMVLPG